MCIRGWTVVGGGGREGQQWPRAKSEPKQSEEALQSTLGDNLGWGLGNSELQAERGAGQQRWEINGQTGHTQGDWSNQYINNNGSQVSHHWRKELQTQKERNLEWTLWCWTGIGCKLTVFIYTHRYRNKAVSVCESCAYVRPRAVHWQSWEQRHLSPHGHTRRPHPGF